MSAQRNKAVNEHNLNIRSGLPVLKTYYGQTIDEYDYLDIAVDFLRDINTFGNTEYIAFLSVDKVGNAVLPCNISCIEAVVTKKMGLKNFSSRVRYDTHTLAGTDPYFTASAIMQSIIPNPDPITDMHPGIAHPLQEVDNSRLGHGQTTEHYAYKTPNESRYRYDEESEGYIAYQLVAGKHISVDIKYADTIIAMAYTGVSVDAEGYPLITRKQSNAIAARVVKIIITKKLLAGDAAAANSLQYLAQEAARMLQASAIPENITDNEIDALLDAKTSFNRKRTNRPARYRR